MMNKEAILNKGLGRFRVIDDRDKSFPMKSALPMETPDRHYKYYWDFGWVGDQEATPQCVAYSWLHWLEDGSITQKLTPPPVFDPTWLYDNCQVNDQWLGENYDGTSVRAGAKVLQKEGYIKEYRWTWDVEELALAVLTVAPVVVGTSWYYGMFFPNEEGFIKPTGGKRGGHAYIINGVNIKERKFRIKNSWGTAWGDNGRAWISFDDMQKLLDEQGEACLAIEIEKR